MPVVSYNLPLHRTGFRPYGLTNTWSATQLNGVGHIPPFTERGGWPLGQIQRGFSPRFLLPTGPRLSGLGQAACDPNDVFSDCYDPMAPPTTPTTSDTCAGPNPPLVCLSAAPDACSNTSGDFVPCSDPSCSFGPCSGARATGIPSGGPAGSGCPSGYTYNAASLSCVPSGGYSPTATGSSPRVVASTTLFPPTAAASATPPRVNCPSGYAVNAQGQCAPTMWTQMQPYLPLILVAVVGVALLGGKK